MTNGQSERLCINPTISVSAEGRNGDRLFFPSWSDHERSVVGGSPPEVLSLRLSTGDSDHCEKTTTTKVECDIVECKKKQHIITD